MPRIPGLAGLIALLIVITLTPVLLRYAWARSQDRRIILTPGNVSFLPPKPPKEIDWVFDNELRLGDFWSHREPRQGALTNLGSFHPPPHEDGRGASASDKFEGPNSASYLKLHHHVAPETYAGHHFRLSTSEIRSHWDAVGPTHLALLARTDLKGVAKQFEIELKDGSKVHSFKVIAPHIDTQWRWFLLPLQDCVPDMSAKPDALHEIVILFHSDTIGQSEGTLQLARLSLVREPDWQPELSNFDPIVLRQNPKIARKPAGSETVTAPIVAPVVHQDASKEWVLFDFSRAEKPAGEVGGEYGSWQSDGGKESSSNEVLQATAERRLNLQYQVKQGLDVGHYFDVKTPALARMLDGSAPTHLRLRLRAVEPCTKVFQLGLKLGGQQYDLEVNGQKDPSRSLTARWSTIDLPLKDFRLTGNQMQKLSQIVTIFSGRTATPAQGVLELQRISLLAK